MSHVKTQNSHWVWSLLVTFHDAILLRQKAQNGTDCAFPLTLKQFSNIYFISHNMLCAFVLSVSLM